MVSRYAQTCPVLYGAGAVHAVGERVKELGLNKVIVVTDEGLVKVGVADKVIKSLAAAGVEFIVFDKVLPDPTDTVINEIGALAIKEQAQGIVAVGGGSVIDAAKGANVLIKNPGTISKYYLTFQTGGPLIAIPTTAGTGSESTSVSVITDTEKHVKTCVFTNASMAILDPELTVGLPPAVTIATGIDVLAHAAEAITAKATNPHSELLAYDAIRKIMKYLPIAAVDGSNIEARGNLTVASNFAGIAFNDALVHLGHAIAHSMGAKFHIPHGLACALALPETMIYAAAIKPDKVKLVGEALGLVFSGNEKSEEIGARVASTIRDFLKKLNVKSCADLGISQEELQSIADLVATDATSAFFPKPLSRDEIVEVLGKVYNNYK